MRDNLIELTKYDNECFNIIQKRASMYKLFPAGSFTCSKKIVLVHFMEKTLIYDTLGFCHRWVKSQDLVEHEYYIDILNLADIKERIFQDKIKDKIVKLLGCPPFNNLSLKDWGTTLKYNTEFYDKDTIFKSNIILNQSKRYLGVDKNVHNVNYKTTMEHDEVAIRTICELYDLAPLTFNRDLLFNNN